MAETADTFWQLVSKDRYQVFLMTCPATLPFFFATHPWLVVNRKGVISRYGVGRRSAREDGKPLFGQHVCHGCVGHFHKDGRPPSEGIEMIPYSTSLFWKGRVTAYIEGGKESLAEQMADFIEQESPRYPYRGTYKLLGPNSNTYVQWVLNRFPEFPGKLPWNSFGKGFAASQP